MGSLWRWAGRARWRRWLVITMLINFSVAVPLSWLLFSYCQATPQCNAELAATGMDGLELRAQWFLSLEMYVLPVAAAFGLLGLIGKPNPAGSRRFKKRALKDDVPTRIWLDQDPLTHVRTLSASNGGGAFLGWRSRQDGARSWVSASGEAAVLVLAPPRAGKTTGVIQPSVASAPGACVVTSIKRDVLDATAAVRSRTGTTWLFDPSGREIPPPGTRQLRWSPVASARSWDDSRIVARAMVSAGVSMTGTPGATSGEAHFTDKATDLLAPLLLAAHHGGRPMGGVADWIYNADLGPARALLEEATSSGNDYSAGTGTALTALVSVDQLADRERSSVLSTAQRVVSAYMLEGPRLASTEPNFDPHEFIRSTDTVYVTASDDVQSVTAPVVVALLTAIKSATYDRQRLVSAGLAPRTHPVRMLLDEAANIAPITELPQWLSTAGGNGLHIVVVFQDLSQAASRWGRHVADGLLTLCTVKLILGGIGDPTTLRALSEYIGNYDRAMYSHTRGSSLTSMGNGMLMMAPSKSTTVSYHRQAVLEPGQIAQIGYGQALLIDRTHYEQISLGLWHDPAQPWGRVATVGSSPTIDLTEQPTSQWNRAQSLTREKIGQLHARISDR